MNRFRTKRRAKDDSSASEQSSMPSFKGFMRGKKSTAEEPKKEFDLTSALPSDDNFRTSLLMTNLSARFSMLREQDDPNTKIGKASDDSVLYPKRQSRLADYGFTTALGGLSDIAEVESIKAPFLRGQVDSYISDDGDSARGGGIMNRGKPTEGNVLFGGRQKIYKIPVSGAASSKGQGTSGMGGRALYEDDVALSAFQLWRQSEKNRRSVDSDHKDTAIESTEVDEPELSRSESPMLTAYNRKRETSSTTSSASAIARYSTAATSVTSQPSNSTRESQSVSTAASSANSTPALERNVTRTRRLYEQALTQDMHEQQSSAFSRLDSLSRQRTMGSRTPDLAQITPSPTTSAFQERFGERRPMLSKASAPNLRSFSPPATASSASSTVDLGIRATPQPEKRPTFGGAPPLSPPISETGDHVVLPIQPNDHGKATAMGVFHKPVEPYDESKYAQRQLQLQSGRDTPRSLVRAESNASYATTTSRSQSSSSMQRQPLEHKPDSGVRVEPTVNEEYGDEGTFLDSSDESRSLASGKQPATPQVVIRRPEDRDHPAFRESALPTPLSMSDMSMAGPSDTAENQGTTATASRHTSPPDSPTLGPTSGLSGMVRHHLRSESNASSVYGNGPQTAGLDDRFSAGPHDSIMDGLGAKSNPWISHEQDTHFLHDEVEPGTDEFASQLADARRRVRERLTSYVETDSSREASPLRQLEPSKDVAGPPSQVNALGIGLLKPKSSRGSLIDRTRSIGVTQSKAMKMLGIGAATMTTSPSPSKQSFDDKDSPRPSVERQTTPPDSRVDQVHTSTDVESETDSKSVKEKDDENVHPGLRAFRLARRELQKRKELETLARHQASQMSSTTPSSASQRADAVAPEQTSSARGSPSRRRMPSRERRPPPVVFRQRSSDDEYGSRRGASGSGPSSRQTSTERARSGSEASNGGHDQRPTRVRNNSSPYDASQHQQQQQLGTNKLPRQLMLRSPGLPGTDIRRSPIMPPQGYPGSAPSSAGPSPRHVDRSHSSNNLTAQSTRYGYESLSGEPSPMSPLGDPMSASVPSFAPAAASTESLPTLNSGRWRRPSESQSPAFGSTTASTMNDSVRRNVNKHDISEPTFLMSTSRVPTVNLHQASGPAASFTGSGSQASNGPVGRGAPPLPPINPRRKREGSGTTDMVESLTSPFNNNQDELATEAQRSPYLVPGSRQNSSGNFVAAGPPASRTVLTPRLKPANTGVPGGMF